MRRRINVRSLALAAVVLPLLASAAFAQRIDNSALANGIAFGSPPTATGTCPINTQVGGNTAGSFKANGACAGGTVILTFSIAAPNGYICTAHDLTTPADLMEQTAYGTASCTLTGSMANADLVTFEARGF